MANESQPGVVKSSGSGLDAAMDRLFRPYTSSRGLHSMTSRSLNFPRLASFLILLVGLLTAVSVPRARAQQPLPNHLTKRVVGDYGYWSKYDVPSYSAAQIPYNELTHINHAGVSFDKTGALTVPTGPDNQFIEPELNNLAHAAGVKVLLLLGGDFVGLEYSGQVQTLVDNIKAFETQYQYDGVDIDWEYPATSRDRAFYIELMSLLRQSNPDYVLSIDIAPWGGYGWDTTQLKLSLSY